MKKQIAIATLLVLIIAVASAMLATGAPAAQGPDAPQAPDSLYTTTFITPGAGLPDNDPTFSCFDLPLTTDDGATVVDVEVSVSTSHTWVGDLIYQLRNPGGEHVTMLNRPGFSGSGFGDSSDLSSSAPIAFGNAYSVDAETMGGALDTAGVICQDDSVCQYFPNPDGDATSLASFAGMVGDAVNGAWQFCASDNAGGDTGTLERVDLTVVYTIPQTGACTTGDWQPIADVNTARSRTSVVYSAETGKFYLLGGEASGGNRDLAVEEYDAAGDAWTDKSHLTVGVANAGAAVVEPYIYVAGGYTGASASDAMQRYDPVDDVVAPMATLPAGNFAHAVTALDGKVYVLGGSNSGAAGNTNYIYDVATNSWDSGAPLPTPVSYAAATTDGTYLYVVGGTTTDLATVQRYDPVGDSWDTIADLNSGRGGAAAFFDGVNVWAVNGGWSMELASTEFWNGSEWQIGPPTSSLARTLGAAYGEGMALKAGGWRDDFVAAAEILTVDCTAPDIEVGANDITASQPVGAAFVHTLTISNTGSSDLTWTTLEAPPLRPLPLDEPAGGAGSQPPAGERGPSLVETAQEGLPQAVEAPQVLPQAPQGPTGIGLTYYADRVAFDVDNPGLPLEDFAEGNVTAGTVLACPAPAHENSDNVCFSPGDILPGILFQNDNVDNTNGLALSGAGFAGNPTTSLVANFTADALEVYFTAPDVNAVGLDVQVFYNPAPVDVTIYGWDGSSVLDTVAVPATPAGVFWGVTSDQPIGRIRFHATPNQFEGLDNIAFGYVGVCTSPDDMPWASVSPANGVTAPGAWEDLQVTFDTTGLAVGDTVNGTLCLNSDDPDEPRVPLPLSLTVTESQVYLPVVVKE